VVEIRTTKYCEYTLWEQRVVGSNPAAPMAKNQLYQILNPHIEHILYNAKAHKSAQLYAQINIPIRDLFGMCHE
jgi:hypothetical protein